VSWVRPDLGQDTERTQETERSTRDRRVAHVEVHRDLAAALEMDASRGMEEPGELGQTIALAARRDRRELVPKILRE
jgi:cytochrome c-type biogenesis protein CcmH/NrfG